MKKSSAPARPLATVVALLFGLSLPVVSTVWTSASATDPLEKPAFAEVGQVALDAATVPELARTSAQDASGWLILNPESRRGYRIYEARYFVDGQGLNRTAIESFDLDTLQTRRRAMVSGMPVTAGSGDAGSFYAAGYAGEVVHAVDRHSKRIYLALSDLSTEQAGSVIVGGFGQGADAQRPLSRIVAIDEEAFDDPDNDAWAASFREPAEQLPLHYNALVGMTVDRRHVGKDDVGRLLALFAHAQPGGDGNPIPLYDHTLVQWDPSDVEFTAGAALATDPSPMLFGATTDKELQTSPVKASGLPRKLDACREAPLAGRSSYQFGNYQWGLLVTREAVWTACSALGGIVVRVALDEHGGLDPVAEQQVFKLSQRISDVLVDEGGERLLVRAFGNGYTWWTFDTGLRRFRGAIAGKLTQFGSLAAGIDPETGRMYELLPDDKVTSRGGDIPVRGGIFLSDTRLDPAPPFENVRPDMAYTALHRIQVDPVTRRVYVHRGDRSGTRMVYPGTSPDHPAPIELFYRVFEDRVPITEQPDDADDASFTTDVPESDLTRASYLGTGSGYGTRALFVGGLAKSVHPMSFPSPCGTDDRELLVGSVGAVEVSDLSTRADAASLDADGKTQDVLTTPMNRCRPSESGEQPLPDSDEAAFDEYDPRTGERTGVNRYQTTCTGDDKPEPATAPRTSTHTATRPDDGRTERQTTGKLVPRDDFAAEARCDHGRRRADAWATGSVSWSELDARQDEAHAQASQVPEDEHVRVGYAHSDVEVHREEGEGVTITVDSLARDIVIPGVGTIGAVRGEATVTATGRRGGATASYRRTVCDIDFGEFRMSECRDPKEQRSLEEQMNAALGNHARVRFRDPDPVLYEGSPSGYKAGVQRPALDRFEDARIARDDSLALPAMELILYRGDDSTGVARQFFHFAGVQAGSSYGIACLYGKHPEANRCAKAGETFDPPVAPEPPEPEPGETEYVMVETPGGTEFVPAVKTVGRWSKSVIERVVQTPFYMATDMAQLLFASPREFGLMAAVWALLFSPCYLGERRRSVRALRARRNSPGLIASG